jgi:hypothetical protein
MGEVRDFVEAEHGPGTLDGVQGAEGPVHKVKVVGAVFELKQRGLKLGEQVEGFFPKYLSAFVVGNQPATSMLFKRSV